MDDKKLKNMLRDIANEPLPDDIAGIAKNKTNEFTNQISKQRQQNVWRIIMKSKMTKYIAAAVILIAVVISINYFGGSVDFASIAWANVEESLREVNWMHLIYKPNEVKKKENVVCGESKQVTWIAFRSLIKVEQDSSGKISYSDYSENARYLYNPEDGTVSKSVISGETFPFGSDGPIVLFKQLIEMEKEKGSIIRRKTGKFKGSKVDIWEVLQPIDKGMVIKGELLIDINTNLPLAVKIWRKYYEKVTGQLMEVEFEYPTEGPRDIYEAGAPR